MASSRPFISTAYYAYYSVLTPHLMTLCEEPLKGWLIADAAKILQ